MAVCDDYWARLARAEPFDAVRYEAMVRAKNELVHRGSALVPWARTLLSHSVYEGRATGAFLLGVLARRKLLGPNASAVVVELGALAVRPWVEDSKEIEANAAALSALAEIGDRAAVPTFRAVLASAEPWAQGGDLKWSAAHALAKLVGVDFGKGDPRPAALEWLRANQ